LLDLEVDMLGIPYICHSTNTDLCHMWSEHKFFCLVRPWFELDKPYRYLGRLQLHMHHKLVLGSTFQLLIEFDMLGMIRMILRLSNIVKYYTLELGMMYL